MDRIPTLSLFTGAGGLDLGFLQAGFDIRACVEIEASYVATLRENLEREEGGGGTVVHCQDIRAFDVSPYKNTGIRCVIGGPPCQTFSAAGRRSGGVIGTSDPRGQLFQAYCRVLDELKPEVFVFENVYGLPGANGGKPWADMQDSFAKRGYYLCAEVVDAADYGVPQHRERLILVGYKHGDFRFPMPTHGPDASTGSALLSVETAIAELQDPSEPFHDDLGGLYGHLLPDVPEGLNYSFFTAEMGHPRPVFAWRSKFHDLLYKVDRGSPCRTLKAQPGKFTGPFHWKNRHFTVPELKRLQSFPDDYTIVGSYGKVMEQIGNSVPPRLAYVIANSVREQLLDRSNDLTFELRPDDFKSTFRQRQRQRSKQFAVIAAEAIAGISGRKRKSQPSGKPSLAVERYALKPTTLFDRRRLSPAAAGQKSGYGVVVSTSGSHIEIDFQSAGASSRANIEISGLKKYLGHIDTLRLTGTASVPEDAFHAWAVIEDALVKRSEFFSLIDIYGHYANRGDTVSVASRWTFPGHPALAKLINYFARSDKAGEFVPTQDLLMELKLTQKQLDTTILAARSIRFDVRTHVTHPIVGTERVLCTYPFPLLSPRALVESKVQFSSALSPQSDLILLDRAL